MSNVPEYKRKESKLKAEVKARILATYTAQICSNEKVFPYRYQRLLTLEIVKEAKDIFLNSYAANKIKVTDAIAAEERLTLQARAITGCKKLLPLIELAHKVYHLDIKRVEYWTRITMESQTLITKWHESDVERYSLMLK